MDTPAVIDIDNEAIYLLLEMKKIIRLFVKFGEVML